jgi:hypothetical protein
MPTQVLFHLNHSASTPKIDFILYSSLRFITKLKEGIEISHVLSFFYYQHYSTLEKFIFITNEPTLTYHHLKSILYVRAHS